jgi:hypothetical protein
MPLQRTRVSARFDVPELYNIISSPGRQLAAVRAEREITQGTVEIHSPVAPGLSPRAKVDGHTTPDRQRLAVRREHKKVTVWVVADAYLSTTTEIPHTNLTIHDSRGEQVAVGADRNW